MPVQSGQRVARRYCCDKDGFLNSEKGRIAFATAPFLYDLYPWVTGPNYYLHQNSRLVPA